MTSHIDAGSFPNPRVMLRDTDQLCAALAIPFSQEQLAAITAPLEPAVIIAGAGSGKTTVMAARVVWLVGTGQVRPDEVLGLTFTRKAAAELGTRVRSALASAGVLGSDQDDAGEQVVQTYDSFAATLVNEHGMLVGLEPDPVMLTGAQRHQLASRVVARAKGPFPELSALRPSSIAERLLKLDSEMTSHLVSSEEVFEHCRETIAELGQAPTYRGKPYADVVAAERIVAQRRELLQLVADYRALKHELGVVEFADQMAMAAQLVQQAPRVAEGLRERFRVVLLDEYQDTSSAQASLLKNLFSGGPGHGLGHPVTAVGDPFQAIYGWRGAAASNILSFTHDFPGADAEPSPAYNLSVNRRSGQNILDVANHLVAPLRDDPVVVRSGHPLVELTAPDARQGQGEVHSASFESWPEEVSWIADHIVAGATGAARRGTEPDWGRVAVLVRRNRDMAELYQALADRDVPVEIVGLGGLLAVPEISDLVAVLRLLDDATHNPSAVQLLQGPRWRVGPRDLALLGRRARQLSREAEADQTTHPRDLDLSQALSQALKGADPATQLSLLDAAADPGQLPYSEQGLDSIRRFSHELTQLRRHVAEPVLSLVRRVVSATGLDIELVSDADVLGSGRAAQVAQFLEVVGGFFELDGPTTLSGLLPWFDAEQSQGVGLEQATPSSSNSVKLLSVHRSKGLEWDVCYLPGLVKGVFPSDLASDNWIRKAEVLPADLRGDSDAIPQLVDLSKDGMSDYADRLKSMQRQSEDRLAYVAATRARDVLVASSHRWEQGTVRPREVSDYYRRIEQEAARQQRVHAVLEAPIDVNPLQTLDEGAPWPAPVDQPRRERRLLAAEMVERARTHHQDTGLWPDDEGLDLDDATLVASWDEQIRVLLDELRLVDSDEVVVPMPQHLSASALMSAHRCPAEFARRLARPMPRQVSSAALVGTRFHEWVERHFADGVLSDPDFPAQKASEEVDEHIDVPEDRGVMASRDVQFEHLVKSFLDSEWARRVPVAVEVPFVLVLGQSQVRGRIDAVYEADDGLHDYLVVDWKTSDQPADPLQLSLYRLAWAQTHGVDVGKVDAAFLHVRSGRLDRPQTWLDEAELVEFSAAGLLVQPDDSDLP